MNPELKIGIVMGGYLDENNKLMTRSELNERITGIKKENEELKLYLKAYVDEYGADDEEDEENIKELLK